MDVDYALDPPADVAAGADPAPADSVVPTVAVHITNPGPSTEPLLERKWTTHGRPEMERLVHRICQDQSNIPDPQDFLVLSVLCPPGSLGGPGSPGLQGDGGQPAPQPRVQQECVRTQR